jgi:hypothetical protein
MDANRFDCDVGISAGGSVAKTDIFRVFVNMTEFGDNETLLSLSTFMLRERRG